MNKFLVTVKSGNKKTGEMIVVTSSKDTCPNVCPFKNNGCYANCGPLRIHWDKISSGEKGLLFKEFISKLREVAKDRLKKAPLRLWQAGDMPGTNNKINFSQVKELVKSLTAFNAFGYTHKPLDVGNNKEAIKYCNDNGVTINLSANNLSHADKLYDEGVGPVVVTLSRDANKTIYTPKGRKVIVCPATKNDKTHCSNCGGDKPLCFRQRDYIIGFPAHGNSIKKVEEVVNEVRP